MVYRLQLAKLDGRPWSSRMLVDSIAVALGVYYSLPNTRELSFVRSSVGIYVAKFCLWYSSHIFVRTSNQIIRQQPIESKDSKLKALYIEKSYRIKEYIQCKVVVHKLSIYPRRFIGGLLLQMVSYRGQFKVFHFYLICEKC